VFIAFAIFVGGCGGVELYQNLAEEDANEILVLLSENDIKADKNKEIRQNEVFYSIEVREADMVKARSLLLQHNLPRRKELGLTGVYKEKGLIPTPDEQKARYLLALKGEIINSLRRIPQIIDADVVLNVPTRDEFASAEAQHQQRPTASAVVRVKPEPSGASPLTEAKIQQFVSNAVEGMNPRDVTVVISYLPVEGARRPGDVRTLGQRRPAAGERVTTLPAVEHKLIGLTLDAESKDRLKIYLLVFFIILIVLSVALIIIIVQGSRMRRTLAALQGPAGEHPAIEGHVLEEGPPQIEEGPPPEDEL
jgi:type III secretion system YscJ/HrcJ family lipoprotein